MPTLTQQLDTVVAIYLEQAQAAAKAEAEYKAARAKRCLRARHEGEAKSVAEAEWIGDSDPAVSDLCSRRLISSAIADATKQKILSLREAIGYERSLMADRRAQDEFHARDRMAT